MEKKDFCSLLQYIAKNENKNREAAEFDDQLYNFINETLDEINCMKKRLDKLEGRHGLEN